MQLQVLIGQPKLPLGSCAAQEYTGAPGRACPGSGSCGLRLDSSDGRGRRRKHIKPWNGIGEGRPAAATQNQRGAFLSRLMEFEAGVSCAKSDESN
ncbi:MAG: hypothetical protein LBU32_10900 [Clostridiales bacterium]|nr:hypothetical protein [Clostridiales bacterium]